MHVSGECVISSVLSHDNKNLESDGPSDIPCLSSQADPVLQLHVSFIQKIKGKNHASYRKSGAKGRREQETRESSLQRAWDGSAGRKSERGCERVIQSERVRQRVRDRERERERQKGRERVGGRERGGGRGECARRCERQPWTFGSSFAFPPLGLLLVNWASQSFCLFYLRS